MNLAEEIETLIRARYPLLYIVSSEEGRVQQMIGDIARRRQKRVFEWSCSLGLLPAGTSIQSQKTRQPATREPVTLGRVDVQHLEHLTRRLRSVVVPE